MSTVVWGGALVRESISLFHGSLEGSHCVPIVDKMLKCSLEERGEKTADIGRVRRSNYDAMGTFLVRYQDLCVLWNDKTKRSLATVFEATVK